MNIRGQEEKKGCIHQITQVWSITVMRKECEEAGEFFFFFVCEDTGIKNHTISVSKLQWLQKVFTSLHVVSIL